MTPKDLEVQLKAVMVKDLRTQCRARGLSPAGGKEALVDRLTDAMRTTGDYTFKAADGQVDTVLTQQVMGSQSHNDGYSNVNNYYRPEGQNVGNFVTDRTSSRVLAPPGGGSQVSFGMGQNTAGGPEECPPPAKTGNTPKAVITTPEPKPAPAIPDTEPVLSAETGNISGAPASQASVTSNNYARPGGMQNVGNFITERSTSRVLAPPGGTSNVMLG